MYILYYIHIYIHTVISQKGDFIPGTENRLVTISGAPERVVEACSMINTLINQNYDR